MPLPTLAAQITSTGVSAPTYAEIYQSLIESFQAIYGSDAYLAPDSQDGQWIAVLASGFNDQNNQLKAVYQAFSPTFAQGAGLSSVTKINGITRQVPTYSSVVGTVVGVAGTIISNGVVSDDNGNLWDLPPITIPGGGSISVTAVAQTAGAIAAAAGTVNTINTPVRGWQTFTSTSDSVPGAPVESDAALRRRQTTAASLPSQSPLAGVTAAVADLTGVTRVQAYENTTGAPDANGLPAHSISIVVEGGDVQVIGETIGQKKTMGAATYGTETITYFDPITGISYNIDFFVLDYVNPTIVLTGTAEAGWNSSIAAEIQQAIANYINSLEIGEEIEFNRLWGPAFINGSAHGATYEVTALTLNAGTVDVPVAFNKVAQVDAANITVTIT